MDLALSITERAGEPVMTGELGVRCYEMARYRGDAALWQLTRTMMFRFDVGLAPHPCGLAKPNPRPKAYDV